MDKAGQENMNQSRIYAKHTTKPMLVIKTNLDPDDVSEENPYFENRSNKDSEKIRNFFEE